MLPFGIWFIYYGTQTPKRIARKKYAKLIPTDESKAEISENGIVISSPLVRTEAKWQAFSQSIAVESVIAFRHGALMYTFPRRAFTDDQWSEFIGFIHQHILPRS